MGNRACAMTGDWKVWKFSSQPSLETFLSELTFDISDVLRFPKQYQ